MRQIGLTLAEYQELETIVCQNMPLLHRGRQRIVTQIDAEAPAKVRQVRRHPACPTATGQAHPGGSNEAQGPQLLLPINWKAGSWCTFSPSAGTFACSRSIAFKDRCHVSEPAMSPSSSI